MFKSKETDKYIFSIKSYFFNEDVISAMIIECYFKEKDISMELGSIGMSYFSEDIYEDTTDENSLILYQNITEFQLLEISNKTTIKQFTSNEQDIINQLFKEAETYMSDYYETPIQQGE